MVAGVGVAAGLNVTVLVVAVVSATLLLLLLLSSVAKPFTPFTGSGGERNSTKCHKTKI